MQRYADKHTSSLHAIDICQASSVGCLLAWSGQR